MTGVGLIGYGKFGQSLARYVAATHLGRVVKVWSRSAEKVALAESHGFSATQNVDEVVQHPEVQAVLVASVNNLHLEHCLKVCEAKKALWAEKPLVLNLVDYDAILSAVEKAGIVNHCDYSLRSNPTLAHLISLADAGTFGRPLMIKVNQYRGAGTWAAGTRHAAVAHPKESGGWNIHHNCHGVDLLLRLAGDRAVQVDAAFAASAGAPSEESMSGLVRFANGCVGEVSDTLCSEDELDLRLVGEKASAFYNSRTGLRVFPAVSHGQCQTINLQGSLDDGIRLFLKACQGEKTPVVPLREGRHVLEVVLAVGQAARTGAPVRLIS